MGDCRLLPGVYLCIILTSVTAVAVVIFPSVQNFMTITLFNKKRNFIIEHNGFSSVIVATIKKHTFFLVFILFY